MFAIFIYFPFKKPSKNPSKTMSKPSKNRCQKHDVFQHRFVHVWASVSGGLGPPSWSKNACKMQVHFETGPFGSHLVIFLNLELDFFSFWAGFKRVLEGFWEGLDKIWAGFVKVLGVSWGQFGKVLKEFSTVRRLGSLDMARKFRPLAFGTKSKWAKYMQ